jgi:hypothetical protein
VLARFARGHVRITIPDRRLAVDGRLQPHLSQILAPGDVLDGPASYEQRKSGSGWFLCKEEVSVLELVPVVLQGALRSSVWIPKLRGTGVILLRSSGMAPGRVPRGVSQCAPHRAQQSHGSGPIAWTDDET